MALNCALPPIGPVDEPGVKYALLLAGGHASALTTSLTSRSLEADLHGTFPDSSVWGAPNCASDGDCLVVSRVDQIAPTSE